MMKKVFLYVCRCIDAWDEERGTKLEQAAGFIFLLCILGGVWGCFWYLIGVFL